MLKELLPSYSRNAKRSRVFKSDYISSLFHSNSIGQIPLLSNSKENIPIKNHNQSKPLLSSYNSQKSGCVSMSQKETKETEKDASPVIIPSNPNREVKAKIKGKANKKSIELTGLNKVVKVLHDEYVNYIHTEIKDKKITSKKITRNVTQLNTNINHYTNTIQQSYDNAINLNAYVNQFKNDVFWLCNENKDNENEIDKLRREIEEMQLRVNDFDREKVDYYNEIIAYNKEIDEIKRNQRCLPKKITSLENDQRILRGAIIILEKKKTELILGYESDCHKEGKSNDDLNRFLRLYKCMIK